MKQPFLYLTPRCDSSDKRLFPPFRELSGFTVDTMFLSARDHAIIQQIEMEHNHELHEP